MQTTTRESLHQIAKLTLFILAVAIVIVVGTVVRYLIGAPSLRDVDVRTRVSRPTVVYDTNGRTLATLNAHTHVWTSLDEMPSYLVDAIVAVEDPSFYGSRWVNIPRIAHAMWKDFNFPSGTVGGNDISIQLARYVLLSKYGVMKHTTWEALYAAQLELRYSKNQILEYYLNWVDFGDGNFGVGAASRDYFGKPVSELTLSEAALIAGLARNPEMFSPRKDLEAALRRRKAVLRRMVEAGRLTEGEASLAAKEDLQVAPRGDNDRAGESAKSTIANYLVERYGSNTVYHRGLSVVTTIDLDLQRAAEAAISSLLPVGRLVQRKSGALTCPQAALVAMDLATGAVRAIVGGRGEGADDYNRALDAERSPGSCMRPFVYVAAIKAGYTPASLIVDEPLSYPVDGWDDWTPTNSNGRFQGPMTLRSAVRQSTNTVAIKLAEFLGTQQVLNCAKSMGIPSIVDSGFHRDAAMAMAAGRMVRGVSPIGMVEGYSALANAGMRVTPYFIAEIRSAKGDILEKGRINAKPILDAEVAYLVTDMMRDIICAPDGAGRSADIGRPAAGVAGADDRNADAWFVGYTPDVVTAVWIGEDTPRAMVYPEGAIGSDLAAQIWARFMTQALADVPERDFTVPEGIVTGVRVCQSSGELASPYCPTSKVNEEKFIAGAEPTDECRVHGKGVPRPQPIERRPESLGITPAYYLDGAVLYR